MADNLLEVQDLEIHFKVRGGYIHAVNGVSFAIKPGERVALVGESGCGKSVTALSIMKLVAQPPGEYVGGSVIFEGQDLLTMPEHEMRKIRGGAMGM
nr:ABC transporter ATP-binding protein [Ktedonobacteraceae bacterium]